MFAPAFLDTDLLEGMGEGQRLARELAEEETKRATKELRLKYGSGCDSKAYAEVSDKVRQAEALNVKVFNDKNVEAAIAMLTQTVSDSDNSIPMDREDATMIKALYQRLAALQEGKERFRGTRDWMKAQEWDKVEADLKSQEAKLKKKEADLFAHAKSQHK